MHLTATRKRREQGFYNYTVVIYITFIIFGAFATFCEAEQIGKHCLPEHEITKKPKFFRVANQKHPIILETSDRISHNLLTYIYKIVIEEKLGYTAEVRHRAGYDPKSITERLFCLTYNNITDEIEHSNPSTVVNVQAPIPLNYVPVVDVEGPIDTCIEDAGTISPPEHFGWFIPIKYKNMIARDENDTALLWSKFKNLKFASKFNIEVKDRYFIKDEFSKGCAKDWFIPKRCESVACAVMLAPKCKDSKEIIEHIEQLNLYIKVAFLGTNLHEAVQDYASVSKNPFLIFSWTPNEIVFRVKNFIEVTMPPCNNYTSNEVGCFYEPRRSVKYNWHELKNSAHDAYEVLRLMIFTDAEDQLYYSLLELYESQMNLTFEQVACNWVRNNERHWGKWVSDEDKFIYIGGIFPLTGSSYVGRGIVRGAVMAQDAINRMNFLPNYDLNVLIADGQCRADKVMKVFIDYITGSQRHYVLGILGPACSETVEPLAGISKYYNKVTVSYSAEGSIFSDKDKYPYFFRTIGENKHYKHVYLKLLKELGWKRVAALTEDGQKYTEYISSMQTLLEANDIKFVSNKKFPRDREKNSMRTYLRDLKNDRARIIIADVFDEVARNVMCEAYHEQMTAKHGYVWFLPTWLNTTWYDTNLFNVQFNETVNCTTANMIEAINGYFSITHAFFGDDNQMMQENRTIGDWKKEYYNTRNGISNYASYAYDGVWAYAYALKKLLLETPEIVNQLESAKVANKLTEVIKTLDFHGVSGHVKFYGGFTRFSVINIIQWVNNHSRVIGNFSFNITENGEILGGDLRLKNESIVWLQNGFIPGDGTELPDECILNSLATSLSISCEMAIIILNIFIVTCIAVTLTVVLVVIKKKYDKRVKSTETYMKSLGLQHLLIGNDCTDLGKWEIEREMVVLNRKLGEGAFGTVYGGAVNFPEKGWTPVAVKTLKIGSTTDEKLDFLSEAEVMKRFDHKNIVKLLGVCTKIEPVFTIMEYMLYGDLKTYLIARRHLVNNKDPEESDEISSKKLTAMAMDVARGLSYLAENRVVHRDVASRNCLLNEQRIVKLCDFGMTRLIKEDYYKFNRRGMLPVRWMAPESLALGKFSPATDVWSYGILLYEIITLGSFPYQGLSNIEVLDYVKNGNTIKIPIGAKQQVEILLNTCWSQDPKLRPSAKQLVDYIANNPRLITPCLDAPASLMMEDSDQLDFQVPLINGNIPQQQQRRISKCSHDTNPVDEDLLEEPLLPLRSDSFNVDTARRHVHASADSGCDQDDYFNSCEDKVVDSSV